MRHSRRQQTFARRFRVSLALAPSLALCGPVAMAQVAPPAASASAAAGTLQTVTVTAERRAENIKDVPSSVSTVSGEKLDVLTSSGQDIRLLSGRVPSLNIESSYGRAFPRVYIRGYGNTDFRANASQPVSLVYDDVVQENPQLKGFPIFDLARVEVLAGPQGSLFGRNTPAGVLKFDSAAPEIGATDGFGSVSFGTYKTTNVEAAKSFALGAQWAARVAVLYQHRDDWVENTYAPGPTAKDRGLRRPRRALAVALQAGQRLQRAVQRPRSQPRWQRARVPRQHHQAGHERPGRRLRAEQVLDRRPQRADRCSPTAPAPGCAGCSATTR